MERITARTITDPGRTVAPRSRAYALGLIAVLTAATAGCLPQDGSADGADEGSEEEQDVGQTEEEAEDE
ncbi:MAG: hypothetical protein Q4F53_04305, partial [Nesterenkonia sp.]|nr:hypothetical protein [Nesterenkonia sp.]